MLAWWVLCENANDGLRRGVLAALLGACGTDDAESSEDVLVLEQNAASTYTPRWPDARGYWASTGQSTATCGVELFSGSSSLLRLRRDRLDRSLRPASPRSTCMSRGICTSRKRVDSIRHHDIRAFLAPREEEGDLRLSPAPAPFTSSRTRWTAAVSPRGSSRRRARRTRTLTKLINPDDDPDYPRSVDEVPARALNEVITAVFPSPTAVRSSFTESRERVQLVRVPTTRDKLFWYNTGVRSGTSSKIRTRTATRRSCRPARRRGCPDHDVPRRRRAVRGNGRRRDRPDAEHLYPR
jgi:hypothetical protein